MDNIRTFVFHLSLLFLVIGVVQGCVQQEKSPREQSMADPSVTSSRQENMALFPKGQKAPEDFFTGTAWVYGLVENDSTYTTAAGNVLFEPSARSNWHSHPAGQILIVTDGVGYHQIKGQPKETIRKGDVVKCPPDRVHWHGASEDSSMSHIYIIPNTENGIVEWKGPVTDAEYIDQESK